MCGRKFSHEELIWAEYRDVLTIVQPPPDSNFQPNYNICPTEQVPVCFNRSGEKTLELPEPVTAWSPPKGLTLSRSLPIAPHRHSPVV